MSSIITTTSTTSTSSNYKIITGIQTHLHICIPFTPQIYHRISLYIMSYISLILSIKYLEYIFYNLYYDVRA